MRSIVGLKLKLVAWLLLIAAQAAIASPIISEFLAANENGGLTDGDGDPSDWIEIHNPDVTAHDLAGYFLTDNADDLKRWQFPAGSKIESGGYLVVFASGKTTPPAGEIHAGFRLNSGGEFLAIVGSDGQVAHSFAPDFPQQYADTSYGIAGDGEARYFTSPTPGAPNVGGISDPQAQVEFSPQSSTFSGTASITLATGNPEARIRYTIDGTDPDGDAALFSQPISLTSTTQIRARVFVSDEEPGPVNSASYLRLGADVGDFSSPLPIVVIENFGSGRIPDKRASNPPAGDGGGIRQVPRQPAFMAIFDRGADGNARLEGAPELATRIGIRVRGSSSASQPAKKENYSVETWSAVDGDQIDMRPFDLPADNDWVLYAPYNYDRALIRNAFVYETMRHMGHYASRTRFVEVFVNTEGDDLSESDFAGVFVFMEKIKRSPDRVDIEDFSPDGTTGGWFLESNRMDPRPEDGSNIRPFHFHTAGPNRRLQGPYGGSSGADRGGDDIPTGYNTFFNFVEPSGYATTEAQRDAITGWFEQFEDALFSDDYRRTDIGYRAFIDSDSFIDHYIITNLTRNVDGLQLSTFLYRPSTTGKLHLNPVWDFDRSMDSYDGRDDSTSGMWGQNFLWFPRLFRDPEFEQRSIDRWQELRRGVLSTENIDARIDAMAAEITEPVAEANFARWRSSNRPRSGKWTSEIAHLKSWLSRRAAWIDGRFLSPPEFSQNGGQALEGFQLTINSADAGTVHYTLDGTDPRLPNLPGSEVELIPESAPASGFVPTVDNGGDQLGESWKGSQEPFDSSGWINGTTGIGFGYANLTGIDASAMRGVSGSAYLRVPFELDSLTLASLGGLKLSLKFEDGFVAYLNGVEVASANRPDILEWNSTATDSHADSLAVEFDPFDVSAFLDVLKPGGNVLAIQVMNSSVLSSDVLAMPQLTGNTGSLGGVSPAARTFAGAVSLEAATTVTARVEKDDEWSGPVQASFLINTVPAAADNLAIAEIMYRPADVTISEQQHGYSDRDEFEYLELMNITASETVDLTGVRLVEMDIEGDRQGIEFSFADSGVSFLHPGGRLVLVENADAFRLRYGTGASIGGQFRGSLSNDGETLTLLAADDAPIRAFAYNDQLPWPTAADGKGFSLVLQAPLSNPDHADPLNWCPSASLQGTPGHEDVIAFTGLPDADEDRDGFPAIVEYALGTDDHDPNSGTDRVTVITAGNNFEFTYIRDLRAKDAQVVLEYSSDLSTWIPASRAGSIVALTDRAHNNNGTESLTWQPVETGPALFFRLHVFRQ